MIRKKLEQTWDNVDLSAEELADIGKSRKRVKEKTSYGKTIQRIKKIEEYMEEMPFAMTVKEFVLAEKDGLMREMYYPDNEKKKINVAVTAQQLRDRVFHSVEGRKKFSLNSLDAMGRRYFKIEIKKKGHMRKTSARRYELIVPKKENGEIKLVVRLLLECFDCFYKGDIRNASNFFKIIYYLAEYGPELSVKELAKGLGVEGNRAEATVKTAIGNGHLDKEYDGKPAYIKRKKKGHGGVGSFSSIYELSPFFKKVWEIYIDNKTNEWWEDWKDYRDKLRWREKRR
ncbi:MAG: hypothetical protein QF475_00775 [Candidatus Undinarchaeales archaeon]|jgi:hypothetical protein|nr:hypothetical protein [Candidatus Undinarchaeales archaeon]